MNNLHVDTDFASDMQDDESENFSGTNQPDTNSNDWLQDELADLENMNREFSQDHGTSDFQAKQQGQYKQNSEDFKEAACKRLEEFRQKLEAEKKANMEQPNSTTDNLSGTPDSTKTIVDGLIDWAKENPLTALVGLLGIGAIGYSLYHNKEKQVQSVSIRKRKHKSYKSYLSEKEQLEAAVSKKEESEKEAETPTKTFFETFKDAFKTERLTEDNKVVETVDTINVVAAVTAAATAATVATKLPVAIGGLSAIALAGIGYSMESPVMMLAGAGLAAGLLITKLLPKTVKSGAEAAANVQENSANVTTEQTVSGVKENLTKSSADSEGLNSYVKDFALSENPQNYWFGKYERESTENNPFGGMPFNKINPFQKQSKVEPEFEFSDTM